MKLYWCIHLEQWHFNSFVWYFLLLNDYDVEMWYWSEFLYNSKFTLMSKKAWNKHCRYKEGWLYFRPWISWFYLAYFTAKYKLLQGLFFPNFGDFSPTWGIYCNLFPNSKGTVCIPKKGNSITDLSKQCRPWWNAALCGISSGFSLFAEVPVYWYIECKGLKILWFVYLKHRRVAWCQRGIMGMSSWSPGTRTFWSVTSAWWP